MRRIWVVTVLFLLFVGVAGAGAAPWQAPTPAEVDAALDGLGFEEFIKH